FLVPDPQELPQQQVLRVHRDVGLKQPPPVAVWLLQREQLLPGVVAGERGGVSLQQNRRRRTHRISWCDRATRHSSSKRPRGTRSSLRQSSTTGARAPVFTLRSYRGLFTHRCPAESESNRERGEVVICRTWTGNCR